MALDFPGVSNCAQLGKPGTHSQPLPAQSCSALRARVILAKFLLPSRMLPNLYSFTNFLRQWNTGRFSETWTCPKTVLGILGCLAKLAFGACSQTMAVRGWGHSQILQPIVRSVCLLPDTHRGRTAPGSPGSFESHRGTLVINRC